MLFATLLLLITSTPSFASLIARQVYVEECDDGRVIAHSNPAITVSCVASATSGLSVSLTTQFFRLSNSTTISHNLTSSTSSFSFTSTGVVPTSTHPSLESTRSGDTSTYSTSITTSNHAYSESTKSLGSSLSIPSGTSQAYFGLNAASPSTASSSASSSSTTNSGNTSSQSTMKLKFSISLNSSGLQSKYRGTGTASRNSTSNLDHTSVPFIWTSPELRGPSRASSSNTYPPSFRSTEASSSPIVSSATPGSTSSQTNQSYRSNVSPAQTSQTPMSNDSATPANSSSVASSASIVTIYSAAVPILTTTVPSSTNTGITSEIGLSGNIIRSNLGNPSSSYTTRVGTNGANIQTTVSVPNTTPASITGFSQSTNTASLGNWPATITFCSESSGQPIVGYGFVTTHSGGLSSVTNSIPSQKLVSTSTGLVCAGEVAVINNGLTTTIELSTLASATSYPQLAAAASVEVLTQSGVPIIYDIETLSGYQNSQPILISTDFVEVVNGQTTTQAGKIFHWTALVIDSRW